MSSTDSLKTDDHLRCPLCSAVAEVVPSDDARFVCSVCGGCRIVIGDSTIAPSAEMIDALARATQARNAKMNWRLIAAVVTPFGVVSLLVLWLAISYAHPPGLATFVAVLAALVPFGFAVFAFKQASSEASSFQAPLDRAWAIAAADIARARGGTVDAGELAKLTRIGKLDAERLLESRPATK